MSLRKLKFHEQKLLKKVDFLSWKQDQNIREVSILRKYHIQKREDYLKYNIVGGLIKKLVNRLLKLDSKDPFRIKITKQLLEKLFSMGLIGSQKNLAICEKITASCFCRRRLPVVMVRLKMAENLQEAITFIEQGHVRVGPETITDPAFLVTRTNEDYVKWTEQSKIYQKIQKYNDKLDDYVLLGNS
eukprot:TRINITY_DN6796_c0_g1_i1.p1 TRINITY_DN6796_c0_g1~~TRINITY_DN6796_c0_g1_i1.p1  ORF type:complete len:195 (+),score=20.27 TRINITY_DN6796_c0_g1_i1:26-586(+)